MGLRFRKSIKLGGLRINFSKSGIGYSFGGKGARITKMANGRTRTTLSVPGTGISYVSESSSKKKSTPRNVNFSSNSEKKTPIRGCAMLVLGFLLIVLAIAVVALIILSFGKKDGVDNTMTAREVIYAEGHPSIYDTITSVEDYISNLGAGDSVRLMTGVEYSKADYDGAQSETDGIVEYVKGATYDALVEHVKLIIDDENVASELNVNSLISLYDSYLPEDFYNDYELRHSYYNENDELEMYVASFVLTSDAKQRAYYFTIYINHNKAENSWVIYNDFEPKNVDQVRDSMTWDFPYPSDAE